MNERIWIFLKPLVSTRIPRNLIFLDTETYSSDSVSSRNQSTEVFRLACLSTLRIEKGRVTRHKTATATERDEFWDIFTSWLHTDKTTWVFAHNLGFDLTVLRFWERVESGDFTWRWVTPAEPNPNPEEQEKDKVHCGYVVTSDPPTIVKGWWLMRPVVFVDWINYQKQPLRALGEQLGIPKLPMPTTLGPSDEWAEYCRRDVEILEKSVVRTLLTWEQGECGPWGPTAATLAYSYFRRRSLPQEEIEIHTNDTALAYERWGYFGGQVINGWVGEVIDDCFYGGPPSEFPYGDTFIRSGPIYLLDVNSLYPSVMAADLMPARLGTYLRGSDFVDALLGPQKWVGVAYVRINAEWCDYPVRVDPESLTPILRGDQSPDQVPFPKGSRTIYARGRYWTVLSGQELVQALRAGHIDEVFGGFLYHPTTCFRTAVYELWKRKADAEARGDKVDRRFWKSILNSLYGKFGQKGDSWVDHDSATLCSLWGEWLAYDVGTKQLTRYRSLAGHVQRLVPAPDSAAAIPAIAACVTAGGRARMREMREIAGISQTLYQDTDSLHVTPDGYDALCEAGLVSQTDLGMLKIERIITSALYLGQKQYRVNGQWVLPGLTPKGRWLGGLSFVQPEFQRLGSILSSNPPPGVPVKQRTIHYKRLGLTGEKKYGGYVLPHRLDCV